MKLPNKPVSFAHRLLNRAQPVMAAFLVTAIALPASAGITLPTDPLQSSGRVAPNILFILDDSGSMGWDYMPDSVPRTNPDRIESLTYARNSIYYNPAITYKPWVDSTGVLMSGGTDYAAVYTNNNGLTGVSNLSSSVRTYYVPRDLSDVSEVYLSNSNNYYRYQIRTNGDIIRSQRERDLSNNQGLAGVGCSNSNNGWQWKYCTETTGTGRTAAEERQNFATWYSYHRTRMKVAKAGAGNAFADLGKDVRVGFRTIWGRTLSGNAITENKPILVDRNDGLFDDPNGPSGANNNRSAWYDRLYGSVANDGTPLHAALRKAGEYYSNDTATGPYGPQSGSAQFACRQNFTILTTDGYWNSRNNADLPGEQDNVAGSLITNPAGGSYQYQPAAPYSSADSNTLADMAMKYWKTDLRPSMDNIVPTSSGNPAFWQHMVTFGISIGEQGTLNPEADLPRLAAGEIQWPTPGNDKIENIDDLWHASVNGRGKFLVAKKPDEFASGLKASLAAIVERTGSFSNVAASSTRLDTGTQLFQASFVSGVWTGELKSYAVSDAGIATDATWSASAGIPASGRKLFTYSGTAASTFPTATQESALGPDIAAYVAGDRSGELNNGGQFRNRNHLLGDIVSSSPAYDAQTDTIFVGANDGMLHAFSGSQGLEQFAYVPGGIDLQALKTLSDTDYAHRYFVDGPLVLSRREQTPGKTILVGSLGQGGKGIFSLDVSNPGSFGTSDVKWESTETSGNNMGLVLGKPIIAKLNNGVMGVIVPNGINSSGDRAALLVYRLSDGHLLAEINTGEGSAADPNGLSAPTTRDLDGNGTVDLVLAGDLHGNLWKFDLSSASPTAWSTPTSRSVLFKAESATGGRQPITSAPAVARDPKTYELWVFFGTGRFLTEADVANKGVQSLYGLKIGDSAITSRSTQLQKREIVVAGYRDGVPVRGFEASSDLTGARGWYIDLVTPPAPGAAEGERIVSDAQVVANVLITSSILSSDDPCLPGGKGYLNALDAFTGSSLGSSFFDVDGDGDFSDEVLGPDDTPIGSIDLGVGMPTLSTIIGNLLGVGGSSGSTEDVPIDLSTTSGRVSWREIIRE